jgi:kumamolisin
MDYNQSFQISIYLNNDIHDNGMTLKEYADAVLAGTQPILDHGGLDYHFGATDADMALVSNWATANGLTIVLAESAIATIKVSGTLGQLGDLFKVTVREVTDDIRTYITTDHTPTIPSAIVSAVRAVGGFDQSFLAEKHAVAADLVANPDLGSSYGASAVTPVQMATAYNVPTGDGYGGCIGIFELSINQTNYNEGWQQPDVTASFSRIGLTAPSITTINVDSAYFSPTSSVESMLDIYCAGAVAPRAQIAYYISPNTGTTSINDNINAAVNDTTNNPSVLSMSWGLGDTSSYDTAFQAGVVKGMTFFVSSGDSGAVNLSMASTVCSQYVVSCGGTNVTLNGSNALTAEVAWGNSDGSGHGTGTTGAGATGGGQSSAVAVPSWQSGLTYKTTTTGNSGGGTATALSFRGVPDWSAPGDPNTGYVFFAGGTSSAAAVGTSQYGGTSAAAPLLAGIWVRLNVLLGYRIPFNMTTFYSNSSTLFNDVATGNNRDGYTTGYVCTTGWDAVTGLGSPKADQLYKYWHTGSTFPKGNRGFRPATGAAYPRITQGART